MYGRENRLKVARDEAKFEEDNKLKRERHVQAEREARRAALLQRARQRQAEHQPSDIVPTPSIQAEAHLPEEGSSLAVAAVDTEQGATALIPDPDASSKGQRLKHINFWHEDELKMAHPEVQAEKKMEQKRRGNKDTQTSDAKFDEQFKLGHQMAAKPWYSQKVCDATDGEPQLLPDKGQHIAFTAGTELLLTDAAVKQHKHDKRKQSKKDRKQNHSEKDSKRAQAKSVEELRAERQAREQKERNRQDRLLHAHRGFAQPARRRCLD